MPTYLNLPSIVMDLHVAFVQDFAVYNDSGKKR